METMMVGKKAFNSNSTSHTILLGVAGNVSFCKDICSFESFACGTPEVLCKACEKGHAFFLFPPDTHLSEKVIAL